LAGLAGLRGRCSDDGVRLIAAVGYLQDDDFDVNVLRSTV